MNCAARWRVASRGSCTSLTGNGGKRKPSALARMETAYSVTHTARALCAAAPTLSTSDVVHSSALRNPRLLQFVISCVAFSCAAAFCLAAPRGESPNPNSSSLTTTGVTWLVPTRDAATREPVTRARSAPFETSRSNGTSSGNGLATRQLSHCRALCCSASKDRRRKDSVASSARLLLLSPDCTALMSAPLLSAEEC